MSFQIKGVYTAIVTPFDVQGNIDEATYRNLIDFQIENGIDGIVPCGTTGESPTLSHEEHDRLIEITVEHVNKRVPVVAGTGSNSTREAVRLSTHAKRAGVDGVMVVNPYYNKPTQKGLLLHFSEVANAVDIPVMVYNIKGRTGVNVETDTLMELCAACENIIAVKEASGDLEQMKSVISRRREGFSVMSGDDTMALKLVGEGGDGVVSVASNIIPGKMVEMVHCALQGDIQAATALETPLVDFFKAMFVETNPIPIKTAMAVAGKCQEIFRLPMCSLSTEENRKIVTDALAKI
ncbi:MAG: 4-hydroxy-tetrahydrodipicolinate synthase [Deltaproteobacteria bacterium]|jgi:4-hydroxy-tetrahydrodipicolinate synthase|nr:4-hydroxy-tetrahydrodipicolinate synthase [Deltaproteobacteria bacterium]MBT4267835.1 4-hydroxy-tetrahydrodipicolinate synthase [Deltaproteobacteria bacterium]MBT7155816.1 4-hydroxy-tetrahydrodipicolinate synthase [Deltaproteobacteria bacterium]MBT7713990.1 4-hydroxy-tetrahydrodipicolinate synthase [Deltaproteobacteria bacterium]MBT7892304.1 4-hydroxy-tetrahydrodipicolinate synthase [Deltaproteobacteria bacterium]